MKLEELYAALFGAPDSSTIYLHDHPDNGGSKMTGFWTRGQMVIFKDGKERVGDPEREKDDVFLGIHGCARCGEYHEMLMFKRLQRSLKVPNSNREMTHWSMCPAVGEPILLEVVKTEN